MARLPSIRMPISTGTSAGGLAACTGAAASAAATASPLIMSIVLFLLVPCIVIGGNSIASAGHVTNRIGGSIVVLPEALSPTATAGFLTA